MSVLALRGKRQLGCDRRELEELLRLLVPENWSAITKGLTKLRRRSNWED